MLRWLRPKPEIVYHPEVKYLGNVKPSDWESIMPDQARALKEPPAIMIAMNILLKKTEAEIVQPPIFGNGKTIEESKAAWEADHLRLCYEANLLRYLLRLPFSADKVMKRNEEKEKSDEKEKEKPRFPGFD